MLLVCLCSQCPPVLAQIRWQHKDLAHIMWQHSGMSWGGLGPGRVGIAGSLRLAAGNAVWVLLASLAGVASLGSCAQIPGPPVGRSGEHLPFGWRNSGAPSDLNVGGQRASDSHQFCTVIMDVSVVTRSTETNATALVQVEVNMPLLRFT